MDNPQSARTASLLLSYSDVNEVLFTQLLIYWGRSIKVFRLLNKWWSAETVDFDFLLYFCIFHYTVTLCLDCYLRRKQFLRSVLRGSTTTTQSRTPESDGQESVSPENPLFGQCMVVINKEQISGSQNCQISGSTSLQSLSIYQLAYKKEYYIYYFMKNTTRRSDDRSARART